MVVDAVEQFLVVLRRVPGDVDDRDRLVLGQLCQGGRTGCGRVVRAVDRTPRAGHAGDIEVVGAQLLQFGQDVRRRLLQVAGLGVHHHLAGEAVLAVLPRVLQQIHHGLGLGAGQAERVLVVGTTKGSGDALRDNDEREPRDDHEPSPLDGEAGESGHVCALRRVQRRRLKRLQGASCLL